MAPVSTKKSKTPGPQKKVKADIMKRKAYSEGGSKAKNLPDILQETSKEKIKFSSNTQTPSRGNGKKSKTPKSAAKGTSEVNIMVEDTPKGKKIPPKFVAKKAMSEGPAVSKQSQKNGRKAPQSAGGPSKKKASRREELSQLKLPFELEEDYDEDEDEDFDMDEQDESESDDSGSEDAMESDDADDKDEFEEIEDGDSDSDDGDDDSEDDDDEDDEEDDNDDDDDVSFESIEADDEITFKPFASSTKKKPKTPKLEVDLKEKSSTKPTPKSAIRQPGTDKGSDKKVSIMLTSPETEKPSKKKVVTTPHPSLTRKRRPDDHSENKTDKSSSKKKAADGEDSDQDVQNITQMLSFGDDIDSEDDEDYEVDESEEEDGSSDSEGDEEDDLEEDSDEEAEMDTSDNVKIGKVKDKLMKELSFGDEDSDEDDSEEGDEDEDGEEIDEDDDSEEKDQKVADKTKESKKLGEKQRIGQDKDGKTVKSKVHQEDEEQDECEDESDDEDWEDIEGEESSSEVDSDEEDDSIDEEDMEDDSEEDSKEVLTSKGGKAKAHGKESGEQSGKRKLEVSKKDEQPAKKKKKVWEDNNYYYHIGNLPPRVVLTSLRWFLHESDINIQPDDIVFKERKVAVRGIDKKIKKKKLNRYAIVTVRSKEQAEKLHGLNGVEYPATTGKWRDYVLSVYPLAHGPVEDWKAKHEDKLCVYISNINFKTTDEELKAFFKEHDVCPKRAWIMRRGLDQISRGFGFARFATQSDMEEALKLSGKELNDFKLVITKRKVKPEGKGKKEKFPYYVGSNLDARQEKKDREEEFKNRKKTKPKDRRKNKRGSKGAKHSKKMTEKPGEDSDESGSKSKKSAKKLASFSEKEKPVKNLDAATNKSAKKSESGSQKNTLSENGRDEKKKKSKNKQPKRAPFGNQENLPKPKSGGSEKQNDKDEKLHKGSDKMMKPRKRTWCKEPPKKEKNVDKEKSDGSVKRVKKNKVKMADVKLAKKEKVKVTVVKA